MSAKKLIVAALLLSATSATLAQGYSTNATRVWGHGYHEAQYGGSAAPANPGAGIGSQR